MSIQRGDTAPQALFASNDLVEALEHLGDSCLPGLEAASTNWQPADTNVVARAP